LVLGGKLVGAFNLEPSLPPLNLGGPADAVKAGSMGFWELLSMKEGYNR